MAVHYSRSAGSSPGATSGPRSASSVTVPPEREKTQELMRSHERLNRRSASVSGECCQVTETGVTEPGLQAGSPALICPACAGPSQHPHWVSHVHGIWPLPTAGDTVRLARNCAMLLLAALPGRRAFLGAAQRLGCLEHALGELPVGVEQLLGKVVDIRQQLLRLGHVGHAGHAGRLDWD